MTIFTADYFEADSALASQFAMNERCLLKPGEVPTLFHGPSTAQVRINSEPHERSLCKRTADAGPVVSDEDGQWILKVSAKLTSKQSIVKRSLQRTGCSIAFH